ncbi:MAG: ABC transporter substrate-binding protein [Myxococcota bacterium]
MDRIVSLLPAATEIVAGLGLLERLVGRSHECDHPASASSVPVLTAPRSPLEGSSEAIHQAVMTRIEAALSVFEVDADALREAAPDLILTQDLCDVCAVSRDDVTTALGDRGPQLVNLRPVCLDDIFEDIRRVGMLLEREALAVRWARELEDRAQRVAPSPPARPTVLALEWVAPPMVGGLWMHEVIELAGGEAIGPLPGTPAQTLSPSELAACNPEVVVVKPCGMTTAESRREVTSLQALLPWSQWPRLRGAFLVDGHHYFNRPGPRIVESIEVLAACLAPDGAWADAHGHDIWRFEAEGPLTALRAG